MSLSSNMRHMMRCARNGNERVVSERSGQIMIESIIAITIGVVGLLSVLGILSRSLSLNRELSQKFVATYLAAEGLEIVKNMIDEYIAARGPGFGIVGWNDFYTNMPDGSYELVYDSVPVGVGGGSPPENPFNAPFLSPTPLYFDEGTGTYTYDSGFTQTPFHRIVQILHINPDPPNFTSVKVSSIVEWEFKGELESVRLEDYFYLWRE